MMNFYRKSGYIIRCYKQLVDWMNGISKHNEIDDECCPDFTCCANILSDDKNAKKIVYDHFMEQHLDKIREYKIKKILKK
jgi:hypothetical protein